MFVAMSFSSPDSARPHYPCAFTTRLLTDTTTIDRRGCLLLLLCFFFLNLRLVVHILSTQLHRVDSKYLWRYFHLYSDVMYPMRSPSFGATSVGSICSSRSSENHLLRISPTDPRPSNVRSAQGVPCCQCCYLGRRPTTHARTFLHQGPRISPLYHATISHAVLGSTSSACACTAALASILRSVYKP